MNWAYNFRNLSQSSEQVKERGSFAVLITPRNNKNYKINGTI